MILIKMVLLLLVIFSDITTTLAINRGQDTLTVSKSELRPCKNRKYSVKKVYDTPLRATIVKHPNRGGWLYIRCPSIVTSIDLNACYLPVQACEEGLTILITGNLLTFPAIERTNLEALPFQLTSLRIIKQ